MLKYKGNPELCVVLLLFGSLGAIAGFGANRLLQGAGRLAIYETDLDQGTPIVSLYVNFPQQGTEQEKVQELASLLSQRKFCELPINVVAFKDKIVTIDLEEHPWAVQEKPGVINIFKAAQAVMTPRFHWLERCCNPTIRGIGYKG
jgi:hypothetical protein